MKTQQYSPYTVGINGVITLSVIGDGLEGGPQERYLKSQGYSTSGIANQTLRHSGFIPAQEGQEIDVVILPWSMFSDEERTVKNIREKAKELGLVEPPHGVAGLIREELTNKHLEEMKLWQIVVMSKPLKGHNGNMRALSLSRWNDAQELVARTINPDELIPDDSNANSGYAFIVPCRKE